MSNKIALLIICLITAINLIESTSLGFNKLAASINTSPLNNPNILTARSSFSSRNIILDDDCNQPNCHKIPCNLASDPTCTLEWQTNNSETISFRLKLKMPKDQTWIGIGFNKLKHMIGTHTIMVIFEGSKINIYDGYLKYYNAPLIEETTIKQVDYNVVDGVASIAFEKSIQAKKSRNSPDPFDLNECHHVVLAMGFVSNNKIFKHDDTPQFSESCFKFASTGEAMSLDRPTPIPTTTPSIIAEFDIVEIAEKARRNVTNETTTVTTTTRDQGVDIITSRLNAGLSEISYSSFLNSIFGSSQQQQQQLDQHNKSTTTTTSEINTAVTRSDTNPLNEYFNDLDLLRSESSIETTTLADAAYSTASMIYKNPKFYSTPPINYMESVRVETSQRDNLKGSDDGLSRMSTLSAVKHGDSDVLNEELLTSDPDKVFYDLSSPFAGDQSQQNETTIDISVDLKLKMNYSNEYSLKESNLYKKLFSSIRTYFKSSLDAHDLSEYKEIQLMTVKPNLDRINKMLIKDPTKLNETYLLSRLSQSGLDVTVLIKYVNRNLTDQSILFRDISNALKNGILPLDFNSIVVSNLKSQTDESNKHDVYIDSESLPDSSSYMNFMSLVAPFILACIFIVSSVVCLLLFYYWYKKRNSYDFDDLKLSPNIIRV